MTKIRIIKIKFAVKRLLYRFFPSKKRLLNSRNYWIRNRRKPVYYVVTNRSCDKGIFSLWREFLDAASYAEKHRYKLIVNMSNTQNMLIKSPDNNDKNVWERYFKQDGLNVIEKDNQQVIHQGSVRPYLDTDWYNEMPTSRKKLENWCKVAQRQLVFSDELLLHCNSKKRESNFDGKHTIGVAIRREFEWGLECKIPVCYNHPLPTKLEDYINDTREMLLKWNCNKVFLSTDDRETLDLFIKEFGEKCIYVSRRMRHFVENGQMEDNNSDEKLLRKMQEYNCIVAETGMGRQALDLDVEENNFDYISEILMLAECECLIAGVAGGSQAAYIMNGGKYKHTLIYNKGSNAQIWKR